VANDGLWYTDGTEANTRRLMTVEAEEYLVLTRGFSSNHDAILFYDAFNCCFHCYDSLVHAFRIFQDLPQAGTRFDFEYWDEAYEYPLNTNYFPTLAFAEVDDSLYLAAFSREFGEELFNRYELVADIWPGAENSAPDDFYLLGSTLFFSATDGTNGRELWRTDGSTAGTELITDLVAGEEGSNPTVLGNIGDTLIVAAETPETGRELWSVDQSTGESMLISDIAAGATSSDPQGGFLFGSELYFTILEVGRRSLWATDGTPSGTRLVFAPEDSSVVTASLCTKDADLLFRTAGEPIQTWWTSDGTPSGTNPLPVDPPTPVLAGAVLKWRIGDEYFFAAEPGQWRIPVPEDTGQSVVELLEGTGRWAYSALDVNGKLFVTNSSRHIYPFPQGDLQVLDYHSGSLFEVEDYNDQFNGWIVFEELTSVNGLAFASAANTCCGEEFFYYGSLELWRSDGTNDGSFPVLSYGEDNFSGYEFFASKFPYRGRMLFQKDGLKISDGTTEGTIQLMPPNGEFYQFAEFNGLAYSESDQFVVTDGTAEGTHAVELLPEGVVFYSFLGTGESLLLLADNVVWRSDGTAAGTEPLSLPEASASLKYLGMWQDRVLFWVNEQELWSTDGTLDGAIRLMDNFDDITMNFVTSEKWLAVYPWESLDWLRFVPPLPDSSRLVEGVSEQQFEERLQNSYWLNDTLFFPNRNAAYGQELWYARADVAEPLQVMDITPGPESVAPKIAFGAGNTLAFTLGPPAQAQSIWAVDPTSGEPPKSYLINPYYAADFRVFARYADKLVFQADDFFHGYAFWGFDLGTSLLSISRDGERKTSNASVDFLVTFTDPVQGLTVDDLALKTWFLKGASIESVETLSPTQYRVSVNTGLGDGTILLMMREDHNVLTPEGERVLLSTDKDYDEGEVYDVLRLPHAADQDGDSAISLSELLRIVQFFNVGALHCEAGTEDGYAPGEGAVDCTPHSSDYNPQDWKFNISELVRAIQVFNTGGYILCETGEDGFCLD
jgi:ELWxxDGT repeat protein